MLPIDSAPRSQFLHKWRSERRLDEGVNPDDGAVLSGPFIGAEALNRGLVRKHELRSKFAALFVSRGRGCGRGGRALLQDSASESPKETWLRLLIIEAGFPKPQTQIRVRGGSGTYFLDMGWEDLKIAVEYDGDQHRTDRRQFAKDIKAT